MKKLFTKKKHTQVIITKRQSIFSHKHKKKKHKKTLHKKTLWVKVLFFLSVFGYGVFVIFLFFFSSLFRVEMKFDIEASQEVEMSVREFVQVYTEETSKFFSSHSSYFLFDTDMLQKHIREHFPFLREVVVEKDFTQRTVLITAKERMFHIIWCPHRQILSYAKEGKEKKEEEKENEKQDDYTTIDGEGGEQKMEEVFDSSLSFDEFESIGSSLSQKEHCFFVDEGGRVFRQTDVFENTDQQQKLSSIVLVGMNGYTPKEGEEIFTKKQIDFFLNLPFRMEEFLYTSIVKVYRVPSPFADEVTLRTQEGWDILLRTDISLEKTVMLLRTFFVRIADDEIRQRLRWVDVRIPEHIYYAVEDVEDDDDEKEENLNLTPQE